MRAFLNESNRLADCQEITIGNETMELFDETISIIEKMVSMAKIE